MAGETLRPLYWAAGLSILAGVLHSLLTTSHFEEWWGYGVFFMLAAMAQGLYGFFILASHLLHEEPITARWTPGQLRAYYLAGIAGNALLVALYAVSRTVGVPLFGPEAGEVEDWDPAGIVAKSLELVIIGLLVHLALRAGRSSEARAAPA